MSWATKRQLLYLIIVLGFLGVVTAFPIYSFFNKPPTCFDGTQNQDELGVDCGGACVALCTFQVVNPIISWSRAFPSGEGAVDVAAFIENPNLSAGAEEIIYSFKVYDSQNLLIVEREGTTFLNPNDRIVILENGLIVGERIPTRTLFAFQEKLKWIKVDIEKPLLRIQRGLLEEIQAQPRLEATLFNQSLENLEDIMITAVLYDKNDNAISVSKTEIEFLAKNSSRDIIFLFPRGFIGNSVRIDIFPHVNVIY